MHGTGSRLNGVAPLGCALVASSIVAVVACGGEGIPGPSTIGRYEDTGCPSADDALAHTKAAFEGEAVALLRPHLERVMVEQGGLRVIVQGFAVVLNGVDQVTLDRVLTGLKPQNGFGAITQHLVEVLRYVDGSSAHVAGAHPQPLRTVHAMMTECEAVETVTTLRELLQLEVTTASDGALELAPPGLGERAWLAAVLDGAREAIGDPAVVAVIESLELEDEAGAPGNIKLGREAFQLLAVLLAQNLAAPDFDPAYTRTLLNDVLLERLDDPAARAKLAALLDVLLLITEPEADVFPQTQTLMACVSEADVDAAIPAMIYDWLTIEALPLDQFLGDISQSTNADTARDLRIALADVLATFETEPRVTSDVVRVLAGLFDDQTAPDVVRALLGLQGQGVLAEVTSLASAFDQCRAAPAATDP